MTLLRMDSVVGLDDVRVDMAMVRTPDGHNKLELIRFRNPTAIPTESNAPANALGIRRLMFAVDDIEDTLARLQPHGAEPVGELTRLDGWLMCYRRCPEGIIVALAEQLN